MRAWELKKFNAEIWEEPKHYLNDTFLSGYVDDSCAYFYEHSYDLARALRMMDAAQDRREPLQLRLQHTNINALKAELVQQSFP